MNVFQRGLSELGVQLSMKDCKTIFNRFTQPRSGVINFHDFVALILDRKRARINGESLGIRFQTENIGEKLVKYDAFGIPVQSRGRGAYGLDVSGLHGRMNAQTLAVDSFARIRKIAPQNLSSCESYLNHVFRNVDADSDGNITRKELGQALVQMDSIFDADRVEAVADIMDPGCVGLISIQALTQRIMASVGGRADNKAVSQQRGTSDRITEEQTVSSSSMQNRLNYNQRQYNSFIKRWKTDHGQPGEREVLRDSELQPEGQEWSNSKLNQRPFRVVHAVTRPLNDSSGSRNYYS